MYYAGQGDCACVVTESRCTISVPSSRFGCEPKTLLKIKFFKKKKKQKTMICQSIISNYSKKLVVLKPVPKGRNLACAATEGTFTLVKYDFSLEQMSLLLN